MNNFFEHSPVPYQALANGLWLIIALPVLGAFVSGVFGRLLGRANTQLVALSAVGGSFVISLLAFWSTVEDRTRYFIPMALGPEGSVPYALGHDFGRWFGAGGFAVDLGLRVDHLSGSLLLVITGVGFLIHLYSTRYMEHDDGYWRYFAYLNLFVAMMLTLVLADNLVLLFVGWEGVGLCSYLLIGFWYTDAAKAYAGRKAFITNRVGDFAFVLGMMVLTVTVGAFQVQNSGGAQVRPAMQTFDRAVSDVGPLQFRVLEEFATSMHPGSKLFINAKAVPGEEGLATPLGTRIDNGPLQGFTYGEMVTLVLFLLLLGAAGKSAQIPLYVWLPDAMAGPTPVSALIHAATMVTAGVYLFCRLSFVVVLSPTAMVAIALIGASTSLLAAVIAFAQDDIKKVLAYSTVSQLGIMFMGVGLGVFWAAVLHLITHAFFKACLFLAAGSVMHGNGDETDIKKLGGLRKEMPVTWATFLISTIAITGVLPLSGFFSKDSILHGIHSTELEGYPWASPLIYGMGLAITLGTAFYMFRVYWLTFEGKRSSAARVAHAHESPWEMTGPLVVLAGLAIFAAGLGIPFLQPPRGGPLETEAQNYLQTVFHSGAFLGKTLGTVHLEEELGVPWMAYLTAWIAAMVGAGTAIFLYQVFYPARAGRPAPAWAQALRSLAQHKFYVDELYEALILRPIKALSVTLYKVVDGFLIDGVLVTGTARFTGWAGAMLRYFQTGDVQSYAAVMVLALFFGVGYALLTVLH